MKYIFTPYQAALDARLITELTTRRVANDKSVVILHERDYANFKPMIEVPGEEETEEGAKSMARTERYAETLEEKVVLLGGTILNQDEALKEITKPEWQGKEDENGTR